MNDTATSGTELVSIEPGNALIIFTVSKAIDPLLERVRREIDGFSADISTATGRKAVASMAHKVARAKTYLDEAGKRLADQQKEIPKKIDATRKHLRDTLDAWRDEVRKPLTDWEDAEKARIALHQQNIAFIKSYANYTSERTVDELRKAIDSVATVEIGDKCEEFVAEYAVAKEQAADALSAALTARQKHDAEQEELARLRAEAAERERKERENRIAKEAADKAQREAEVRAAAARKEAEDAVRREREASERRELELKLAAEQAERRAAEAEAKAKRDADAKLAAEAAETARREANKAHRTKVNRSALAALVAAGIGEESAKRVIELIASKQVPHVSIHY